ncbi:MAG: hypothetical protein U9Q03_01400 [Patescibacteria group bacterium]|nr:hypothetical protein [Patescibacteria group bacterium]
MHRTRRVGECAVMLMLAMALAMVFMSCEGPDDMEDAGGGYDVHRPDRDAGDDADADIAPEDADVLPEDADVLPDGDAEEEELDPREVLALCLSEVGTVLYGAYWCSACRYQKYQFAPYHEIINYVDCYFDPEGEGILDEMKEECQEVELDGRGLEAFPTWVFDDGIFWEGTATFELLAELSGCEWLGEPSEL